MLAHEGAAIAALHRQVDRPPFDLIPLTRWFEDLAFAAAQYGGIMTVCAATTPELLETPREIVVVHGDVHHENILDFGSRGWLAIDPKRLIEESGFDYANLFCNPDAETASAAGRLTRQVGVVAEAAGLERKRLLQWIFAWEGLSTAWWLQDGESLRKRIQGGGAGQKLRAITPVAIHSRIKPSLLTTCYIRSIYSPLSVLILIFSPCRTNAGTMTTSPVSIVAGL